MIIKNLKLSFRYKIAIGFVIVALFSVVLSQIVSKQYVQKLLIKELLKNLNFIPDIIYTARQSIQWNNDILLANKVVQLSKNEDVKSIIIFTEDKKIFISNNPKEVGKQVSFSEAKFHNTGEYLVNYEGQNLSLIKDFIYEDSEKKTKTKYFILIKLSTNKIDRAISELNFKFLLIGLGITLYGICLAFPFSGIFSKKLIGIAKAVRIIGKGNWEHKIRVQEFLNDEIDEVAAEINEMANDLKIAEKLKIEQEVFKQELAIATEIQQTLLPKTNPQLENISTYSFYKSAKEVGGDYFDWINVSENLLGIIMADVSGKGVPGAFVMAMARSTLHSYTQGESDPAEVLKKVNAIIKPDIKKGMFVTMWYGILNKKTYTLKFANAGHLGLLVYKNQTDSVETYRPKGMSIGLVKSEQFNKIIQSQEITLDKHDIILQYTDGVTEAYDKNENLFGDENLKNVMQENHEKSPKELIEAIVTAIEKHAEGCEQSDDIALISLKIE